jgi:hypothetical protein
VTNLQYQDSGYVGVNDSAYGLGVFTASASQTPVPVYVQSGCSSFTSQLGSTVPIPSYAIAPTGTDHSIVIYQPSTDTVWELWQATNNGNGTWSACWGGRIQNVDSSDGVFPYPYGVAASGISYMGTLITENDILSGQINHVLAITVNACNVDVAPANRTDCGYDPGEPSEGTWLRLPANLAMPSGLTPLGQMVFEALQNYGAVVTDRSSNVNVEAENSADWQAEGNRGTDPLTASFGGQSSSRALDGIPWSSLEVINPPR